MTRCYALKRLLEHGALTWSEITTITGWPYNAVRSTIWRLCESGEIVRVGRQHRCVYEVAR